MGSAGCRRAKLKRVSMQSAELIDVVFYGTFRERQLELISLLLEKSRNFSCVIYDNVEIEAMHFDIDMLNQATYLNFGFGVEEVVFDGYCIPNLFVDITKDEGKIELLMFFALGDIEGRTDKERLDILKCRLDLVKERYSFESYICRMDNGDDNMDDEVYFDSHGRYGMLYNKLEQYE